MNQSPHHVYIDTCCLNRPMDDPSQDRIRLEAESVRIVLGMVESGRLFWTTSDILAFEVERTPNPDRREVVGSYLQMANRWIDLNPEVIDEALKLEAVGMAPMDALHLASAKIGGVEFFLTVDDALLRKGKIVQNKIAIRVRNPLHWVGDFK